MDDSLFQRFSEIEACHWWFVARREIVLSVIARLVAPGARLLDVGCGTGYFLERAQDLYEAAGVDPSPIAVEMCTRRHLQSVVLGSATDLSAFDGERFDLITLLDVIEHVDDDVLALRTASSKLERGGRLLVTVPAFQLLWTSHDDVNQHRRRYTRGQLRKAMKSAGLRVEQLSYFNSYLFPIALVERLTKRVLRLDHGADLSLPPAVVNAAMTRIFSMERHRLQRGSTFPVGLSVLAVGRLLS
jgi:2-polyprenyl-3-methyl-5-hydroxy-6-metoxy-1,4-benzoquinol methylase